MAILVDNFSGTPLEGKGLRIELDYAGGPGDQPTFVGYAPPGKLTSDKTWKIMKCIYAGANLTERLWADGDTKFDNVWDDRAGLSYS
jgi:hypothetical protein